MKEISIEDKHITEKGIEISMYHGDDYKVLTRPKSVFETWVIEQEYLEWCEIKILADGSFEEKEGTWNFDDWCKEKLTDEILEKFVRHELEK